MSCVDASCEIRSSLTVRIRGDSRDPGSTPCAFADLIQDFQTTPSVGGLVRPSTTAQTHSICWVFAPAIGVPHLEDESASVTAPTALSRSFVLLVNSPRRSMLGRLNFNALGLSSPSQIDSKIMPNGQAKHHFGHT